MKTMKLGLLTAAYGLMASAAMAPDYGTGQGGNIAKKNVAYTPEGLGSDTSVIQEAIVGPNAGHLTEPDLEVAGLESAKNGTPLSTGQTHQPVIC